MVAGVIFGYYLNDVRKETPTASAKYFAWVSGVLVLAVLVMSFIVIGSPNSARLLQFDQQKVNDLQNIQSQVVNYYQKKGTLPAKAVDLQDSISGFVIPVDPQAGSNGFIYEYNIKDVANLSFELCATFNKPSQLQSGLMKTPALNPIDGRNQVWDHLVGRVCFQRTIDKQLYPVNPNVVPVK